MRIAIVGAGVSGLTCAHILSRKHDVTLFEAADRLGVRATDGREMLVQQGAVSFERWWGRPAPIEAMRSAVNHALTP